MSSPSAAAREHCLLVLGQRRLRVAGVCGNGLTELGAVLHGEVGPSA
jgi:hypothetical protein